MIVDLVIVLSKMSRSWSYLKFLIKLEVDLERSGKSDSLIYVELLDFCLELPAYECCI